MIFLTVKKGGVILGVQDAKKNIAQGGLIRIECNRFTINRT